MTLLPCPFCGSPAALGHLKEENGEIFMIVQCTGSGCWAKIVGYLDDGGNATNVVATWNRRTPPDK